MRQTGSPPAPRWVGPRAPRWAARRVGHPRSMSPGGALAPSGSDRCDGRGGCGDGSKRLAEPAHRPGLRHPRCGHSPRDRSAAGSIVHGSRRAEHEHRSPCARRGAERLAGGGSPVGGGRFRCRVVIARRVAAPIAGLGEDRRNPRPQRRCRADRRGADATGHQIRTLRRPAGMPHRAPTGTPHANSSPRWVAMPCRDTCSVDPSRSSCSTRGPGMRDGWLCQCGQAPADVR